nr:hypothetical protein [uncultured Cellulosilyticum sp.]
MNKFDKYYLKHGKLELSILDEDDDEKVEEKHIHHEEDNNETRQPRIKLTEDIYNTLQTMGKFLTKKVEGEDETSLPDEIQEKECSLFNQSKLIRPEAIKSIQAKQLEEAVKSMYAKVAEEAEDIETKIAKPIGLVEKEVQLRSHKEEKKSTVSNKKPFIFEEDDEDRQLAQSSIDQILLDYFGNVQPQYEYAKRLKRHIDKKIDLIENYQ